jgi:hypothetical protein
MHDGFKDREVNKHHAAWWDLWHDRKDDLKAAGFSIDKSDDEKRWLLSFVPVQGIRREDPSLAEQREAAQRAYDGAVVAHAITRTAMIKAFRDLRKLYSKAEWLAPLVDEVIAALEAVGTRSDAAEAAEAERDVRLMSSVTNVQDLRDAHDDDEDLPADVVSFEQARMRAQGAHGGRR